ncbi:MAG: hypothetical protein Q9187_000599 [Circinaria calcarea]
MDEEKATYNVVDPQVRAYVYSLVSALEPLSILTEKQLGGTGADEDGRYVLGDDALACLKDIKRWLKFYDEKANRLDVARCLAEANLVNGDLLEILAAWPEEATDNKIKSKIALACLELLVPLTWPIEKNELQMTVNHHRHIPYLQLAQLSYKRGILEHESSKILRTGVRIGLPSIALPMGERGPREEGIIRLILYFFRNLAMISTPVQLPVEWNENEVSRSATIEAFHYQEVLALLLTIASNMGEDFNTQDVVILEILFHLLKGVDVEKLFMNDIQRNVKRADELQVLLEKEAGMHRGYAKNAPTRHNRFGTMIWVKRDDSRFSTVSGQDVLINSQKTLSKMDQSKKWNRSKLRGKMDEQTLNDFDLPVLLTVSANQHLRSFVEEFLDSSFNPLFSHLRRAIEREADRVLEVHAQQYFYLVSWFLETERVRRKSKKAHQQGKQSMDEIFEADSFGLVASVLNQETFIVLNRFMQDRLDMKSWKEVNAGMRCLTQILLTVQEMSESTLEEDQEIAENIQNRIFYEETTHDRIIAILRGYKDQGFGYLDACTELSYVFLRMLERYSKENVDLQIRSKRRARKKKRAARQETDGLSDAGGQGSEAEDAAEAQRVSRERKFDFNRFASKFLTQNCINTFVGFTSYYKDLRQEQLKRAHRYFYRVAFKQEMSVMLFRLDIIALFNRMIKGPQGLDPSNPMFREWDELTRQLNRRMIKKLQQRPELAVELLFSKISSTVFYLEYGYEKQTISSKPRAPAELEVKGTMAREEQIGVIIAAMYEDKLDSINFVKDVLSCAASERKSWESEAEARQFLDESTEEVPKIARPPSIFVKPDNDERRIAMFKDNKLRLLMTLVGFERLGLEDEPDATWIVPSTISSATLQETHAIVERHSDNPVMHYGEDDPKCAEDLLRRKSAIRVRRAEFDDDSDGDGIVTDGEEEFLFPAGGPTNRKPDALAELKKRRRRRINSGSDDEEGLDDATIEKRRKARLLADLEKRRKIKSEEYVHDSDDEEDEERDREFFSREEQRGKVHAIKVLEALKIGDVSGLTSGSGPARSRKRKSKATDSARDKRAKHAETDIHSGEDEAPSDTGESSPPTRLMDMDTSDEEVSDTPLSSPHVISSREASFAKRLQPQIPVGRMDGIKALPVAPDDAGKREDEDEDGERDEMPMAMTGRRRARGIFLDNSDSD